MKKKLNKKLLNLIALSSGIAATVAVGIGGIIYSIQENNDGDKPVDQNILPNSVYIIKNNVLMGFTQAFLDNQNAYDMCDTMEIPAKVTEIANNAFYDNSISTIPPFIKNLTFAEGSECSSIGNRAFTNCSSLISIILSNSLFAIEYSAFSGCSALNSIDFSKATNLSSIGSYAFFSCSKLISIDLSNCTLLSSMGVSIFCDCSSLTSINLPNSIDKIPGEAFGSCSALNSIDLSHYNNLSSINSCAFERCTSLTSVSLPESLEEIESSAFWGCSSLSSINFPSNLSSIDNAAFASCSSIVSISLPSNLSTLGYSVFSNCSHLSSITWDAWKGSTALQSNTFSGVCPDGGTVTVINPIDDDHNSAALLDYLLENGGLPQSWAKNVGPELPESVYNIDDNGVLLGFKAGVDLNKYKDTCDTMKIPARVTRINEKAFYYTAGKTSRIPSFITKLTFAEGSSCSKIGQYAFAKAPSLSYIDMVNCMQNFTISNNVFGGCSKLTSVNFPNNLSLLYEYAFNKCTALSSINLLNCVKLFSIDMYVFSGCSALSSVKFPKSLNNIAIGAFKSCSSLNTITWDAWNGSTALQSSAFSSVCPDDGTVTVNNPIDEAHDSAALLAYLKQNGGLPESWHI